MESGHERDQSDAQRSGAAPARIRWRRRLCGACASAGVVDAGADPAVAKTGQGVTFQGDTYEVQLDRFLGKPTAKTWFTEQLTSNDVAAIHLAHVQFASDI
mgnify:CR=1 FL=1